MLFSAPLVQKERVDLLFRVKPSVERIPVAPVEGAILMPASQLEVKMPGGRY